MAIIGTSPQTGGAAPAISAGTFVSPVGSGTPPVIPLVAQIVTTISSPFGSISNSIQALITNEGRELIARMMVEGLSFHVTGFAVGLGGYDTSDPTQSTGPNPSASTLGSQLFPVSGTESIDLVEFPNASAISFLGRLETSEALGGLGEMGLFVTILDSPSMPSEVGDEHLFALAHFPLQGKTSGHVYVNRIVIQF